MAVSDKDYQKMMGQADELIAEKSGKRTGPQLNIGPNMGRENKAAKQIIEKEADKYLGTSKADVSSAIDAYKEGADKAKAKTYAKGGKINSASARADGCAVRGKTKGRMV